MFSRFAKAKRAYFKWEESIQPIRNTSFPMRTGWKRLGLLLVILGCAWISPQPVRAALQFDVFAGFDETIREANWFPVTFEVFNDGPAFQGVVELSTGQTGSGQNRRVSVELPTNTRKRIVLPVFASSRFLTWDAKLLDDRGNLRAEKLNIRLSNVMSSAALLLAAIPKTQAGRPEFPKPAASANELAPRVVRLTSELLPDHPIAMEGMQVLYLSSERAIELKGPQITALITWIYQGGHLIVGMEQSADLNGNPWLKRLAPLELTGSSNLRLNGAFSQWIRRASTDLETKPQRPANTARRKQTANPNPAPPAELPAPVDDASFDQAEMVFATGKSIPGAEIKLSVGGIPAIASIPRGRGAVSMLTFSPDREPFRSWSNRPWFWSQLVGLPASLFAPEAERHFANQGSDGIFGALIDSRQVRKLPVEWLLVLLVVYLVVIGPLDQYWLKKINKQMWTWVTFPSYVAFFSVLIYFIASRLRAGDMEWNELHVVDAIRHGEKADVRGRSFASLYSPVNAKYSIASTNHGFSTVRGEFHGAWGGASDSSRLLLDQRGNGSTADLFVPVWTSQLFVNEWLNQVEPPAIATFSGLDNDRLLTIKNNLPRDLENVHVAYRGRIYSLNSIPAGKSITSNLGPQSGSGLNEFVAMHGSMFTSVVQGRRQAFGRESGRIDTGPFAVIAASFGNLLSPGPNDHSGRFVFPEGFELSEDLERGLAVVFAWAPNYTPVDPIARFEPKRSQRNTMFRFLVAANEP